MCDGVSSKQRRGIETQRARKRAASVSPTWRRNNERPTCLRGIEGRVHGEKEEPRPPATPNAMSNEA